MYYVGTNKLNNEIFYSRKVPTRDSHPEYKFVTGPYRTRKDAETKFVSAGGLFNIWRNCTGIIIKRELVEVIATPTLSDHRNSGFIK